MVWHRKIQLQGVYQFPGLLNTTESTQDMDDMYEEFKGKCEERTDELFAMKTLAHAKSLEEAKG